MSAKNTNSGCSCKSCQATGTTWRDMPLDAARLEQYLDSKANGSAPKDPIYAAHFRHCHPIPQAPVPLPKRGQPVIYRNGYTQRQLPITRNYPADYHAAEMSTREYIEAFAAINDRGNCEMDRCYVLDFDSPESLKAAA